MKTKLLGAIAVPIPPQRGNFWCLGL